MVGSAIGPTRPFQTRGLWRPTFYLYVAVRLNRGICEKIGVSGSRFLEVMEGTIVNESSTNGR